MVKIKQINSLTPDIIKEVRKFMKLSKPYDFCDSKSPRLREVKINQYLDFLEGEPMKYIAEIDGKFACAVFFEPKEYLSMGFVFGDYKQGYLNLIPCFYQILEQASKESGIAVVRSVIQRKRNINSFLKWIKRYDKRCKLIKEEHLTAEWNLNEWTN